MQRTKTVTYDSCDFCDSEDEAWGRCDICGKYFCKEHFCGGYYVGDQCYEFCPEHYQAISSIAEQTRIPIDYVVCKFMGKYLPDHLEREFNERGYAKLWKDEWTKERSYEA